MRAKETRTHLSINHDTLKHQTSEMPYITNDPIFSCLQWDLTAIAFLHNYQRASEYWQRQDWVAREVLCMQCAATYISPSLNCLAVNMPTCNGGIGCPGNANSFQQLWQHLMWVRWQWQSGSKIQTTTTHVHHMLLQQHSHKHGRQCGTWDLHFSHVTQGDREIKYM